MMKNTIGEMVVLTEHDIIRQELEKQGVLPCDGRTLSKEEFPDLYRVIGTQYGSSKDDFKLPNCLPLRYGIVFR